MLKAENMGKIIKDKEKQENGQISNRFAVFAGAGGVFRLVVRPRQSGEVLVVDGEVLRLLVRWLRYHADWR